MLKIALCVVTGLLIAVLVCYTVVTLGDTSEEEYKKYKDMEYGNKQRR